MAFTFDAYRAEVITPTATYEPVRFIYRKNRAAIWDVNLIAETATRLFLLTDADFHKRLKASQPHRIIAGDVEWLVWPKQGGCGCGGYPLKRIPYSDLLGDDFTHVP